MAVGHPRHQSPYPGPSRSVDQRLEAALARLTLVQKIVFTVWDTVLIVAGPVVGGIIAWRSGIADPEAFSGLGTALGLGLGGRVVASKLTERAARRREEEGP